MLGGRRNRQMKMYIPNSVGSIIFLVFVAVIATAEERTTVSKGPFTVGMGKNHILTVYIESITGQNNLNNQVNCDRKLFIKDQDGNEVYRDQYTPRYNNEGEGLSYVVSVVDIPKIGAALLINKEYTPSAPGTGSSYRLFHFNSKSEFVPISGIISPYRSKINADCFEIVEFGSIKIPSIKSKNWTTSFYVVYHYPINPDGIQSVKPVPIIDKNVPVEVDIEYTVQARENNEKWYPERVNEITLYSKMDLHDHEKIKVSVSPESEIQFLDATPFTYTTNTKRDRYWLHIIIDGKEGYVTGLEDFMKLGLPFAG